VSPGPWRYTEDEMAQLRAVRDADGQEIANLTLLPDARRNGPVMAAAWSLLELAVDLAALDPASAGPADLLALRERALMLARSTQA
jgi:hypothetical protein